MNKITLTFVCPENATMDRMKKLGELLVKKSKATIKDLEKQKLSDPGEVNIGTPGFGLVLSMSRSNSKPLL